MLKLGNFPLRILGAVPVRDAHGSARHGSELCLAQLWFPQYSTLQLPTLPTLVMADCITHLAHVQRGRTQRSGALPVQRWSRSFVRGMHRDLDDHLRGDLAASTRMAYASHVAQFRAFCVASGVAVRPAGRLLAAFVMGRVHQGFSFSTIDGDIAAVARWAFDLGSPDLAKDVWVKQARKVAAKRAVRPVVQKLPLSHEHLSLVARWLSGWRASPQEAFLAVRDRALFVVGWAGMFRSSELVGLFWEEVHFFPGRGVALFIPSSKTDPGLGAWVFLAEAPAAVRALCPVRALRALQGLSGVSGTGVVFPTRDGASRALSKSTVGPRLRRALRAVGVRNASLFAAHSLRRGGATHAARVGMQIPQIQRMGRWRSDTVRLYTYCSPGQLWRESRRLLQA